jgi:hypothetical protein
MSGSSEFGVDWFRRASQLSPTYPSSATASQPGRDPSDICAASGLLAPVLTSSRRRRRRSSPRPTWTSCALAGAADRGRGAGAASHAGGPTAAAHEPGGVLGGAGGRLAGRHAPVWVPKGTKCIRAQLQARPGDESWKWTGGTDGQAYAEGGPRSPRSGRGRVELAPAGRKEVDPHQEGTAQDPTGRRLRAQVGRAQDTPGPSKRLTRCGGWRRRGDAEEARRRELQPGGSRAQGSRIQPCRAADSRPAAALLARAASPDHRAQLRRPTPAAGCLNGCAWPASRTFAYPAPPGRSPTLRPEPGRAICGPTGCCSRRSSARP